MRIVVIAGQARKVGKTSVMAGLIRSLRWLNWAAVKISVHDGMVPHLGASETGRASDDRTFILAEDTTPSPFTDTGRYLAAGARRAFWLSVKSGSLEEAVAALLKAIANEENVMIESGSAMGVLQPAVRLIVLDRSRREMKPNVRRALARADALVEVASSKGMSDRVPLLRFRIRRFAVSRKSYSNRELSRFILLRLKCYQKFRQ